MLDSAKHLQTYVAGVTFDDFWANNEKRDAVALRLSVMGEAARHITKATEIMLPTIPFKELRGMRNRVTHNYGQVNFRIVWEVTQKDISPLVAAFDQYFASRKAGDSAPPGPSGTGAEA